MPRATDAWKTFGDGHSVTILANATTLDEYGNAAGEFHARLFLFIRGLNADETRAIFTASQPIFLQTLTATERNRATKLFEYGQHVTEDRMAMRVRALALRWLESPGGERKDRIHKDSPAVPAPLAPAAESVLLVPSVPSLPPVHVPVSSGPTVAPPGPGNASSSGWTAPVTTVVGDTLASLPAVLGRLDQVVEALQGIARQRKPIPRGGIPGAMKRPDTCRRCIIKGGSYKNQEHLCETNVGAYRCTYCISEGKPCVRVGIVLINRVSCFLAEIDKTWADMKNYNKAQDALPSDKKVIQQLEQLIGICRFSAMMAAFDHGIPMADVDAVGLETNEKTEVDDTAGQGSSSG
ncbi:hypothetical protein MMC07_000832 [Pseudocyphellaria aurata]|nr:hypothetical protein [Pseudocyphellaria aurata]